MGYFEAAVAYTLTKEGRLSSDANDRAGLTKWGVIGDTLATYQRKTGLLIGRSVASLTREEAIAIYRSLFWRYDGIENRDVAIKLFDYGVNVGLTQAVLFAQRALVTLEIGSIVDGLWGPVTLAGINRAASLRGRLAMMKAMCYHAARFYVGLVEKDASQLDFIDGWAGAGGVKAVNNPTAARTIFPSFAMRFSVVARAARSPSKSMKLAISVTLKRLP